MRGKGRDGVAKSGGRRGGEKEWVVSGLVDGTPQPRLSLKQNAIDLPRTKEGGVIFC